MADYWESVVALNTWQQHRIARLVVQKLFGTVTGKRLAILGFAFKADTNDTREAPAIRICRDLWRRGRSWPSMIPRWLPSRWHDLQQEAAPQSDSLGNRQLKPAGSVEDAVVGADAVLVLTEWHHYRELNWPDLAAGCASPPGSLMPGYYQFFSD